MTEMAEVKQDWVGNQNSVFMALGASNHSQTDREPNDYYATDPKAVEILLQHEVFSPCVWECACGEGHITKVLESHDYKVKSSDVVNRGLKDTEIIDFLEVSKDDLCKSVPMDIVTNPPYKYAKEFVEKAIDISIDGTKIAMLLRLSFLEGKARKQLFEKHPPKRIYVFSSRIQCAKNGDFKNADKSAVCYAWFVWEKGFTGEPVIKWVN